MRLKSQKRLAANVLKVGENRIVFDKERLDDIKEAITKADIRELIRENVIIAKKVRGNSRARARKRLKQYRKGRRRGEGSRKGKSGARLPRKKRWVNRVRSQRSLLQLLKEKNVISSNDFRNVYNKINGGFFRSKRHIKLYLEESGIIKDEKEKKIGKDRLSKKA